MQRWGIFLIYAYLRQIYNFKSCPSSWPISPQSLHSVQYSVTLKKGKEIFQSAREFTFCLLQTILIMIIKPFKFIGMAKLQKILQKINGLFTQIRRCFVAVTLAIAAAAILISARGLRPGSTVCSESMIDWQYLLLEDLEQIGIFPKIKS